MARTSPVPDDTAITTTNGLSLPGSLRPALARRDVQALYRELQAAGLSQRTICALTGQRQSEISDIAAGRVVRDINLLERICDRLGLDRALMRLGPPLPGADTDDVEPIVIHRARVLTETNTREPTFPATPPTVGVVVISDDPSCVDVARWGPKEISLLRLALRMSVRQFAAHLDVSDRVVSTWESGITPRPNGQELLDAALRLATPGQRTRFLHLVHSPGASTRPPCWVIEIPVVAHDRWAVAEMATQMVTALALRYPGVGPATVSRPADAPQPVEMNPTDEAGAPPHPRPAV